MSYSPSFDVLFGGLITFFIALAGVYAERRFAQKERRKERLEVMGALVFSLQIKIASGHGWLSSTKRSIDECFFEADAEGNSELDPAIKVKPLVGAACPTVDFSPEELALLLRTGDSGLVEKVLAFQWNVQTAGVLIETFNRSRLDYSRFVADHAGHAEWNGSSASMSMPSATKHTNHARVAELNTLIGSIMEQLESGLSESKMLILRVQTALKTVDNLIVNKVELA